ncbi:hypothetical protein Anas_01711 [Armadillidium nasatum]|uniref:Nucleolus and neural progenitor protein-like N-terminal domain-containing protein n=1 Tax=Armadillidium nasatum TaxID=96803 RepID=A0A5N5TJI6_9CRUS|nr:hypothetical protein Anas_01711 [Armadillidium nasatum]
MNIWNERFIASPPNITVLFEENELSKLCELTTQKLSMRNSLLKISSPEIWVTNLNNLLKTANKQLFSVSTSLELELKCLHSYIYQGGGVHKKEKIRLPSPKSMYYLLHRLVGAFHLLLRSISYCLESSYYFKAKLVRGFSISTSTLGFAVIGRIRALELDICNIISTLSDQLNPYVMAMIETKDSEKVEDLPNNLQQILTEFLENKNVERGEEKINKKTKKTTDSNAAEVSEDDDFSFTSLQASENVRKESENLENRNIKHSNHNFTFTAACKDDDEDLGDFVPYSKFEELKKLSDCVLETSKSKEYRKESNQKFKKRFADEDNCNFKNKKQKVVIEKQKKNCKKKKIKK